MRRCRYNFVIVILIIAILIFLIIFLIVIVIFILTLNIVLLSLCEFRNCTILRVNFEVFLLEIWILVDILRSIPENA